MASAEKVDAKGLILLSRFILRILKQLGDEAIELGAEAEGKSSQHLLGRAADFYVEGVDVATVAAYAETLLPGRGGIGRYPKDAKHLTRKTGWVHIDTRANKSRWTM